MLIFKLRLLWEVFKCRLSESEKTLRKYLVWLLKNGDAHMRLDDAIEDFPMTDINKKFPRSTYSAYGAMEHIRRTQWDILDFIRNPDYKEQDWPADYWPAKDYKATAEDWNKSVKGYKKDLEELVKIVEDPKTDLYAKIPWGTGQIILREILLVADHTAYEIGEMATARRAFKHWEVEHP